MDSRRSFSASRICFSSKGFPSKSRQTTQKMFSYSITLLLFHMLPTPGPGYHYLYRTSFIHFLFDCPSLAPLPDHPDIQMAHWVLEGRVCILDSFSCGFFLIYFFIFLFFLHLTLSGSSFCAQICFKTLCKSPHSCLACEMIYCKSTRGSFWGC